MGIGLNASEASVNAHLIIFCGVAVLAVIQLLLVVFFIPEIPVEMLMLKRYDKLHHSLFYLYNEADISRKMNEL